MGILSKIFSNTRKPEGFFGRMMVNGMNGGGHARMAEWGLSHLTLFDNANVLDVGCGGGANVARLLKRCPKGTVTGIGCQCGTSAEALPQREGDGHRLFPSFGEEKLRSERRRHCSRTLQGVGGKCFCTAF